MLFHYIDDVDWRPNGAASWRAEGDGFVITATSAPTDDHARLVFRVVIVQTIGGTGSPTHYAGTGATFREAFAVVRDRMEAVLDAGSALLGRFNAAALGGDEQNDGDAQRAHVPMTGKND